MRYSRLLSLLLTSFLLSPGLCLPQQPPPPPSPPLPNSIPKPGPSTTPLPSPQANPQATKGKDTRILILGGGVTGVIAARTLSQQGYTNFLIVEAREELGGRLQSIPFGEQGREYTVELGANWVQGTQRDVDLGGGKRDVGPENPVWGLAKKYGVKTRFNDLFGSVATFDHTGRVDYLSELKAAEEIFTNATVYANERMSRNLVDVNSRTGLSLIDARPRTPAEQVSEYFLWDWEYAQTPEQTSLIASSITNNSTFTGFSDDQLLSIDPRGFKTFIQQEASTFLQPDQLMLNATISSISYSPTGVSLTLSNGETLEGDYALCTFSVGVLQSSSPSFVPALPEWKREAIHVPSMPTYTKIFFQFEEKFWWDEEMALYADESVRGWYPVWQSLDHENFLEGSGILFVTIVGDDAIRASLLPPSQIKSEALSVLSKMYPDLEIPEPTAFTFHNWNLDPLFRGSYSNWPGGYDKRFGANLRATVQGRMWFAGEATCPGFYGFLQGAYFEGLNVTTAMIECIEQGGCEGLPHVENVSF